MLTDASATDTGTTGRRRLLRVAAAAALLCLALSGWCGVAGHQLRYSDDLAWLIPAQTLGPARYAASLALAGTPTGNYRPLAGWFFLANYLLVGCSAAGYFAANLALHALTSLLVYLIVRRVLGGEPVAALVASLVFAAHPVHRVDLGLVSDGTLLVSLFVALSILAFSSFMRRPAAATAAAAVLCFGLALLAKETAAAVPLVLACLGVVAHGWSRRSLARIAAVVVPCLTMLGLFVAVDLRVAGEKLAESSTYFLSWHVLKNLARGAVVLLAPDARVVQHRSLEGAVAAVVLCCAVWVVWRRDRILVFCLVWLGAMLLPGALYADYWGFPPGYQHFVFAHPASMPWCAVVGILCARGWRRLRASRPALRGVALALAATVLAGAVAYDHATIVPRQLGLYHVAITSTLLGVTGCDAGGYLSAQALPSRPPEELERARLHLQRLTEDRGELALDPTVAQLRPLLRLAQANLLLWSGDQAGCRASADLAARELGGADLRWHQSRATDVPAAMVARYVAELCERQEPGGTRAAPLTVVPTGS